MRETAFAVLADHLCPAHRHVDAERFDRFERRQHAVDLLRPLKRAGLDYWQHVDIVHWDNLDAFLRARDERHLFFFTTKVKRSYIEASFQPGDYLIFGRETRGLPEEILSLYNDRCYTVPMKNPNIRSLNLAMTAGIVLYEAIRQIDLHGECL